MTAHFYPDMIPIVHNQCAFLGHFKRSEAKSRHETKWRAQNGNLFLNRFLHFGPLCGTSVEMTKAQIIITIGMNIILASIHKLLFCGILVKSISVYVS